MTVKECYEMMGEDPEEVLSRLMSEDRVAKYLQKFAEANDVEKLEASLEEKDWETAFRGAHNLKGLSLNLGFGKLRQSSDILCEALRGGEPTEDIAPMLTKVKEDYENVVSAISQL